MSLLRKPQRNNKVVIYEHSRWLLLNKLREKAIIILKELEKNRIKGYVIGSVARGDVTTDSDIDIFLLDYVPTDLIKYIMEKSGLEIIYSEIVQSTPTSAVRANLYVDEKTSICVPLSRLSKLEEEFTKFAGRINLEKISLNKRVPGVNKNLLLVIPIEKGHIEYSIIGREPEVARVLNVSIDIVYEREKMLLRRNEEGRHGIFIRKEIPPNETPESVALKLARRIPSLRKKLSETLI